MPGFSTPQLRLVLRGLVAMGLAASDRHFDAALADALLRNLRQPQPPTKRAFGSDADDWGSSERSGGEDEIAEAAETEDGAAEAPKATFCAEEGLAEAVQSDEVVAESKNAAVDRKARAEAGGVLAVPAILADFVRATSTDPERFRAVLLEVRSNRVDPDVFAGMFTAHVCELHLAAISLKRQI